MIRCTVLLAGVLLMPGENLSAQTAELVEPEAMKWLRLVEDPDGQTNIRDGASTKAKVVGQVLSGAAITILPEATKNDWEQVDDYSEDEHYIHSSRLKKVTSWKQYGVTTADPENKSGVLKLAGAEVQVKAAPFDVKQHKVTKDENNLVSKIDGGQVWGRDGDLPAHTIALTVKLGGVDVPLPKEAVEHLYEPSMESLVLLTPGDPAKRAWVYMMNGDGAGAYCVVWAFENGGYRGRVTFVPF